MHIDSFTADCFLAVYETGNFTYAAKKMGRTQSAISQQISKLEKYLNTTMFIRGKNVTLTTDGQIFLNYAKQVSKLHHEILDRFREPDLKGEVRFGLPEDFSSVFLSDVLSDFISLHPRVLLHIECDLTMNLFHRFKRKDFDLVLVKMNKPDDFPNGIDVWTESLEWVGHQRLLADTPLPLVLAPAPCVYHASAIKALEAAKIKWRIVFSSPSFASTIAAVKAGLGITVLPRTLIPKELKPLPKNSLPALADTHISLLKHKQDNAAINSFEQFVMQCLK